MHMSRLLGPAALTAFLALTACSTTTRTETTPAAHKASMGMVNTSCPFSGKALTEASPRVDYNGQKVGVCCNACAAKFSGMDQSERDALMSKSK